MSNVTKRGAVKPTLNITPLIDVVFLLIVFFLLVNNIVTDEAPPLKLPDLEKPETRQVAEENRLVINIVPKEMWEGDPGPGTPVGQVLGRQGEAESVKVGGRTFPVDDPEYLTNFREFMEQAINARRAKGDLRFIFRVDATIYYYQVVPVMDALQSAMADAGLDPEKGETLIDIVAYMPKD